MEKQITRLIRLIFKNSLVLKNKKEKDIKFSFSLYLIINNPPHQCMIMDTSRGFEKETSHFLLDQLRGKIMSFGMLDNLWLVLNEKNWQTNWCLCSFLLQYSQIICSEMPKSSIYSGTWFWGSCVKRYFKAELELWFKAELPTPLSVR